MSNFIWRAIDPELEIFDEWHNWRLKLKLLEILAVISAATLWPGIEFVSVFLRT
jgi:hypothetical protein